METTVYKIEVENKDILFFEDFIKRMSMKVLDKEEKNTYSKEFAKKIKQAREERQWGETIKISSENLWRLAK